jgi:hypothetical protein
VRSISFRTDFFFVITGLERSIGQPAKYFHLTSVHTPSLVCLFSSVYELQLSGKVSFLYTSWRAEINGFAIIFFFKAGLSATEALLFVQKADGNEAMNRSGVFRRYSQFRDGRELVEDDERGGRPESTRTEANIAAVADLVKDGPSNRIKNVSRIFEHPQDCSCRDSERGFWK